MFKQLSAYIYEFTEYIAVHIDYTQTLRQVCVNEIILFADIKISFTLILSYNVTQTLENVDVYNVYLLHLRAV